MPAGAGPPDIARSCPSGPSLIGAAALSGQPSALLTCLQSAKARLSETITARSDAELHGKPWYGKCTKGRVIRVNTLSHYTKVRGRIHSWVHKQGQLCRASIVSRRLSFLPARRAQSWNSSSQPHPARAAFRQWSSIMDRPDAG
ncbi:ClbS/DfsB family four-helix bundle protein [Paracoccus sp. IB05]|nr:ClbS/DfsB family four-helix bundle protein [Paracoccus sp. IB05]